MNKMNLPPPFGPERKRPEFPSSSEAIKSDELKYYGPNLLKQQEMEEDEDEDVEFSTKRIRDDNPFNKTEPTTTLFVPEQPAQVAAGVVLVENKDIKTLFVQPAAVRTCIPRQEILKHRISKEEMSQQKAFNNYSYGEPSCKLYLRNMVKDVTETDLLQLFGCFFDSDDLAKEYLIIFGLYMFRNLQIRVMEGRMRGQAFVTFPSVELAREALTTVNGYILKDKPIVVVSTDYVIL